MRQKPDISFIVSTYKRSTELTICLKSLELQTGISSEILVADNFGSQSVANLCNGHRYFNTSKKCRDCYSSANLLVEFARGRYVCFPSDDNYYVPTFGERLYSFAKKFKLDLAYCDFVYDDRVVGSYQVIRAQPLIGHIDKGGFILKREKFPGFKTDRRDHRVEWYADGMMIESLRTTGIRFGKIGDVLWVHN